MLFQKRRTNRGSSIAETAAAMSLMLPLTFALIFAVLEASYFYMLKSSLSQAAREAARDLSVAYAQDPTVATDRTLQNTMVFDHIRIQNVINSDLQFDNPVFQTANDPPTVSATVHYSGGQYGLPTFPNPD